MIKLAELGKKSPKVCLRATNGQMMDIKNHKGKWVALYFYPRDNTPGCTKEALEFSAAIKNFHELNAVIIGVSPDSVESHQKFAKKMSWTSHSSATRIIQSLNLSRPGPPRSCLGKSSMVCNEVRSSLIPKGAF